MKVVVEVDKCIGAGQCVRAAPTVFDQNEDDGLVILLQDTPPDELLASVKSAARLCPARVIIVQDG